MSEKTKIRIWNGCVIAFMLILLISLCMVGPVHEAACNSISRDLWNSYSGFYNQGYEAGYQDAEAGRERASKVDYAKDEPWEDN